MKYKVGDVLVPLTCEAIDGRTVSIPDPLTRFVLLCFSRWAGCPICNMHLASYKRRAEELGARGILVVIAFHSPTKDVRELRGDLPFTLLADPERRLYRAFGVGRSLLFAAYPKAFRALRSEAAKGRKAERIHGILGLPADFLVDRQGKFIAAHYGVHADDSLGVDEVLSLVQAATSQS